MDPITYNIQPVDIYGSALKGMYGAIDQRNAMNQQQVFRMWQENQARQAQYAAMKQQEQYNFATKPNKTVEDFSTYMALNPEQTESLKTNWNMLDTAAKEATFKTLADGMSLSRSGFNNEASTLFADQAKIHADSGDTAGAQHLNILAQLAKTQPQGFQNAMGTYMTAFDPERAAKVLGTGATAGNTLAQADITTQAFPFKTDLELQKTVGDIAKTSAEKSLALSQASAGQYNAQTNRMEVLKKDEEKQSALEAKKIPAMELYNSAQDLKAKIQRARDALNKKAPWWEPGGYDYAGGVLTKLNADWDPDSYAARINDLLDPIRSSTFVTSIQEFKRNGGTLGAISDKEGERMTSWQASLKVGQDRKTLLEGLKVIEDYANKVSDSAKYYSGPNTNPIVGYLPGSGVVTQDQLRQLKDKYPNIDMDALLTKMGLNYYGK